MYQSNIQNEGAFIAAVKSLEKLPIYWQLQNIRRQNAYSGKIKSLVPRKCTCDEDYDTTTTINNLLPIFQSTDNELKGVYSVLPFFYCVSMNKSNALPIVEVVELPLVYKELYLENVSKETIDEAFFGTSNSYIVRMKSIDLNNLSAEIQNIRKNILLKIFSMTSAGAMMVFSCFSGVQMTLVSLFPAMKLYLNTISATKENIEWEKQPERYLPIKYKNCVFTFQLSSWVFSKHEV